jgi:hypothetical protein
LKALLPPFPPFLDIQQFRDLKIKSITQKNKTWISLLIRCFSSFLKEDLKKIQRSFEKIKKEKTSLFLNQRERLKGEQKD